MKTTVFNVLFEKKPHISLLSFFYLKAVDKRHPLPI